MTLTELIEQLQEIADDLGEEAAATAEVRLAIQPRWAMEYSLGGVALSTDIEPEDENDDVEDDDDEPPVVYLAEGRQLGYAPQGIWQAAR
ncbi:MAG: hypothetical protein ACT4PV_14820 [Planctomycetaceae bacterium]